jgi:hypothetical protein
MQMARQLKLLQWIANSHGNSDRNLDNGGEVSWPVFSSSDYGVGWKNAACFRFALLPEESRSLLRDIADRDVYLHEPPERRRVRNNEMKEGSYQNIVPEKCSSADHTDKTRLAMIAEVSIQAFRILHVHFIFSKIELMPLQLHALYGRPHFSHWNWYVLCFHSCCSKPGGLC